MKREKRGERREREEGREERGGQKERGKEKSREERREEKVIKDLFIYNLCLFGATASRLFPGLFSEANSWGITCVVPWIEQRSFTHKSVLLLALLSLCPYNLCFWFKEFFK